MTSSRSNKVTLLFKNLGTLILLLLMFTVHVSAQGMSVNDLIGTDLGVKSEQVFEGDTGDTVQGNTETSNYSNIIDSSKVDLNNNKAAQATDGLRNIVGVVISFLCYAIVILLALRVILDVFYIAIPFTRQFLFKQNGPTAGMGNSVNGYNGGFTSQNMSYGGVQQQNTMNSGRSGVQLISNAAINAVAAEAQRGSAFKMYMKDMMIVLIVTPILIVLATNGSLITLGFKIAELITEVLGKISGRL